MASKASPKKYRKNLNIKCQRAKKLVLNQGGGPLGPPPLDPLLHCAVLKLNFCALSEIDLPKYLDYEEYSFYFCNQSHKPAAIGASIEVKVIKFDSKFKT